MVTSANTVTSKEKFDACMKQADFLSQRAYNRQGYQWKVTLGLWAAIAAFASFAWQNHIWVHWSTLLPVLGAYRFIWLRAVAINTHDDLTRALHFRDQAANILVSDTATILHPPEPTTCKNLRWWFEFLFAWAHLFEFLTTAMLLAGTYLLLLYRRQLQCLPH